MAEPPKSFPVVFVDPDTGVRTFVGTAAVNQETGEVKVQIKDPDLARTLDNGSLNFFLNEE